MSLTIVSASNPEYLNAQGTSINLMVKFAEFPEPLHFHATLDDVEPHGVELYKNAKDGQYGEIAAYVPPELPKQPSTSGTHAA